MKRIITLCAFIGFAASSFGQIKLGAQAGYGLEAEKFGFGANLEIFVMEKLSIVPNIYLWGKEEGGGLEAKAWEANVDVHYNFVNSDAVGVYGLAGLNVGFASIKGDILGVEIDEKDNKVGVNIGAGATFLNSGKVSPFVEAKYETNFEQIVIGGGVKFTLKGKK